MDSSTRWIGIAMVLGLCTAYALWGGGGRAPATPALPGPGTAVNPADNPDPKTVAKPHAISALKMNPEMIDFGEVKVSEAKTVTVQVENPTGKTITISDVKGSCGCLKAEMKERSIEPGKSAPLSCTFTGQSGKRPEAYTVSLITDEEGKPRKNLPINGKVLQVFIVEPQALYFEDAVKGVAKTKEATITRVDGKPFKLVSVAANHKEFSFKWEPLPGSNGSAYKVLVTVTGSEPDAFTEGAAILTDDTVVKAMPLNIGVRITGEVVANPPFVTAIQRVDGTIESFETVIKRQTPGKLTVKGVVESDKRAIEHELTPIDDSTWKLKLTLSGAFTGKQPMGDFLIQTDVDATPLKVPYRVFRPGTQRVLDTPPAEKVLRP